MLPGLETLGCSDLAVPPQVMHHVVRVESSYNPFAIGVVGGHLVRQPKSLDEALATVRMLETRGFNFSLGLAQVNRYNLPKYGLESYEQAFDPCTNLRTGSRILAECHRRSKGDWGKAFSCYYSGNFVTGYRHGYVQKVFASMRAEAPAGGPRPIDVVQRPNRRAVPVERLPARADAAIRRGTDPNPAAAATTAALPGPAPTANTASVAVAPVAPGGAVSASPTVDPRSVRPPNDAAAIDRGPASDGAFVF